MFADAATRQSPGTALLVAGYDPLDVARAEAALAAVGRLGALLLSAGGAWTVRRLAPGAHGNAPDRLAIKRNLDHLAQEPCARALVVVSGVVVRAATGPALITGSGGDHEAYPEDATLPLAWIGAHLRRARAGPSVVVLSLHGADRGAPLDAAQIGAELDLSAEHLLLVHLVEGAHPVLTALLDGLRGAALDPEIGAITPRSVATHVRAQVAEVLVAGTEAAEVLLLPVPLTHRWNAAQALETTAAREPPPEPAERVGTVLPGQLRLDAVIASGGFGTVFRGHQLAVGRDVAVKVLHDAIDFSSDEGRLFLQEVQAVGRIDHPNVVRVFHADVTADGRLFFAMELLAGRDLQRIADEGRLEPSRAVALVRQLLAALAAAHQVGLVHADVKPANVLVVADRGGGEHVVLVDFGLARLRELGQAVWVRGGTPAFMAPEQLADGRVDVRSDLFSAALVLVHLLTGWRRRSAGELLPPFDGITDFRLRRVLERALALDPARRFQRAIELSAALVDEPPPSDREDPLPPPFHNLASFTEADRGRLLGRDREIEELSEHVLYRRAVIFTAPSGAGKTSLLRAGLLPRLHTLGVEARYVSCRASRPEAALLEASRQDASRPGTRVLVLDQLEAWLAEDGGDAAPDLEQWPAEVGLVLSVREDYLARLLVHDPGRGERIPLVRMGPLELEGAREAIVRPLAERRLSIEPALLQRLLDDLAAAAASLAPELGWGGLRGVYPPHLQLACTVLYRALGPGENELTLAHYQRLGGLTAIVGEHLDRVLETEFDVLDVAIARDLFLALVAGGQLRAAHGEAELVAAMEVTHDRRRVRRVLDVLCAQGLLVRITRTAGQPVIEIIHDSLVPRVLGWIDRHDLGRRRVLELVRHHLRRSRPEAPSLLGGDELRELDEYPDALRTLEAEWAQRPAPAAGDAGPPWTPTRLVRRSRYIYRRTRLALAAVAVLAAATVGGVGFDRWKEGVARRHEQSIRDRDLGRVVFELTPFSWDPETLTVQTLDAHDFPALDWKLYAPDLDDPSRAGLPLSAGRVIRHGSAFEGSARLDRVEASGGAAFLVIGGRGAAGEHCRESIVRVRALPGYARRDGPPVHLRVNVPTCAASAAGTLEIPAGPFVRGGLGEPPSQLKAQFPSVSGEETITLPAFRIDRTEVSNAQLAPFAEMAALTGVLAPSYPNTPGLYSAAGSSYPVGGVDWYDARAFCQFLGKELPTSAEWEKAMRGGLEVGGRPNPYPRRNLPWGVPINPTPARLRPAIGESQGPAPVGSTSGDMSPYGVMDLAGNMQEWTDSVSPDGNGAFRVARGGYWEDVDASMLGDFMAIENTRLRQFRSFGLGMRCVSRGAP